jgi:hypothetical protein
MVNTYYWYVQTIQHKGEEQIYAVCKHCGAAVTTSEGIGLEELPANVTVRFIPNFLSP